MAAAAFFPQADERQSLKQALAPSDSGAAEALVKWLGAAK